MEHALLARFLAFVEKRTSCECWNWAGAKIRGYGYFRVGPKQKKAHRVAYELFKGPIPEGLFVCHHCDNPSCVNPEHLYAGTAKDNRRDTIVRNRANPQRGEGRYNARLTEDAVRDIRSKQMLQREYAAKYGVGQTMISAIQRGVRWKGIV
jgi:HNH endonuclease